MVNQQTVQSAVESIKKIMAELGLPPDRQPEVQAVCETVLWQVVPLANLGEYLVERAGLNVAQAEELVKKIKDSSSWRQLWQELEQHVRHLDAVDLNERFQEWDALLSTEVQIRQAELERQPSLTLLLEEFINNEEKWDALAVLTFLAEQGRLIATVTQIREVRDGFKQWVTGVLQNKGIMSVALPATAEQWTAPWVSLLLEYLIQVRLYFTGEEAALIASSLGQRLAKVSGDHNYATIAYGDDGRDEFVWRPVKVEGNNVVWGD